MDESLFSKLNEGLKGESLFISIVPLLKLISLTLMGVLLAHPKAKLVPRATFKLLSKLVFALFLPCLIFNNLGQTITLKNITLWWFIPLNVILSVGVGCFLGYLVALICRPPPQFFRFTIIMTAIGNMGNLPLAFITSICHTKNHPFGKDCQKNGIAYDSFSQWVAISLVYTFVYHMMEPPLEYYEVIEDANIQDDEIIIEEEVEEEIDQDMIVRNDSELSMPILHDAEWPGMDDKDIDYSKTPFVARVFNSLIFNSLREFPDLGISLEEGQGQVHHYDNKSSSRCLPEPKIIRKIRIVAEQTPIKHILSPPIIASFLAILVGMVPQMESLVFGDEAPLSFITDSFQFMARAMMPFVMLVLGGMLAEGPEESTLGLRTTIGIIVVRLLVLPLVGIGVLLLTDKWGLLVEGDLMFRFVIFLHYVTPSAILLGAIASLRGYAVQETSAILFWQHVFAVVSTSLYIYVFFKFLTPSFT
ncbi:unnamed protein product [Amaranthus hypochondriacus]